MKMTQFANFANNATNQILGVIGLQRENLQSMFSYPDAINISDPKTVEGGIIYIDDGTPLEAKRITTNINPFQIGRSGSPTPEYPKRICGWDNINIIVASNKTIFGGLPFALKLNELSYNSTLDEENKTVTFTRYKSDRVSNLIFGCFCENRITAIITYTNSSANASLMFMYDDGTTNEIRLNTSEVKTTILVYSTANKNVIGVKLSYQAQGLTTIYYDESGFIDGVITIDEFEPFNGTINTINIPNNIGTIYGGFINVTNGSISIDRIKLKLGDFTNWNWHTSTNSYTASRTQSSPFPQLKQGNIVCEIAPYVDRSQLPQTTLGISISVSGTSIFLKDNVHSGTEDLEDFVTAIKDVEAVFYIYTPQYYQIEPTEIMLLNGVNTIYADCGSMELEYYRRDNGGYMNG